MFPLHIKRLSLIRNKLEYITDNFLDVDILCFTEFRPDANITTEYLMMSSKYDIRYKKERTYHGGVFLMYFSCGYSTYECLDILE